MSTNIKAQSFSNLGPKISNFHHFLSFFEIRFQYFHGNLNIIRFKIILVESYLFSKFLYFYIRYISSTSCLQLWITWVLFSREERNTSGDGNDPRTALKSTPNKLSESSTNERSAETKQEGGCVRVDFPQNSSKSRWLVMPKHWEITTLLKIYQIKKWLTFYFIY